MAEIQKTSLSGEMTQRFIEFVMMQSQHAALFLGQIENPQTGQASVNLEAAHMFIDQLVMIRQKTRGNLTSEESKILNNALANLQMAYIEVSGDDLAYEIEEEPSPAQLPAAAPASAPVAESPTLTAISNSAPTENKKRFSKSYGS